ncbi:MFS transporter [Scopulibacillus cellulosilyticus]|uniref:MFS transporter n=1 Tax=Scopulibacillus cellulosilyticus TaxID=2665665 RepID=A0ABW2PSW3_9BACL
MGRKSIIVLIMVWLAFLFSFVDRLSWPPIIPLASKSLDITNAEAGSYMTAFYIGYVITQLPGGLLTDRFGYRKVLLGSFLIMGCFTMGMGMIHTYLEGFIMRVLAGLGSGAVFSACVRAIFDWFPSRGRTTAMGFFMTASSFGLTVVNMFVPSVAKSYSWHTSFVVAGLLPIAGLILSFFLLKERTHETQQAQRKSAVQFWKEVAILLKNRNLMLTGLSGFCAMWATWGTATWANAYMNKGLHISLVEAGAIMSVFGLAAIICKPIIGILSDLLRLRRKTMLFFTLIFFGPILIWFESTTNISMLYIIAALMGIAAYIYSPIMNTYIGELADSGMVGTATGLVNTIYQLGSLFSPLAVGAVIDATHNYLYAFITLAAGPVLAALIILLVNEKVADRQQAVIKSKVN